MYTASSANAHSAHHASRVRDRRGRRRSSAPAAPSASAPQPRCSSRATSPADGADMRNGRREGTGRAAYVGLRERAKVNLGGVLGAALAHEPRHALAVGAPPPPGGRPPPRAGGRGAAGGQPCRNCPPPRGRAFGEGTAGGGAPPPR